MASAPLPALSLGLGELQMQSFLNEPLRAELALLDTRDLTEDDIRIRLAGIDDFERLGVDRSYFLTGIQFEIDLDPGSGRGVIRLTTDEAVLEPYLDIIVEARWPSGRVLREYTILVDPPAFRAETITVSASERVDDLNPDKPALSEESRAELEAERAAEAGPAGAATTVGESTGDRVAMRQSSLPPGAMPERAFSAETSDTPVAGSRYMVKRDETLWQIASRGRPGDISVQQAMLDIQRINPEAFIDGNINRIKAGYIIYLPAAGEVASEDLAAAIEEVRAQNQAFEARRATPGVSAAATLRVSADPEPVAARAADSVPGAVDTAADTDLELLPEEAAGAAGVDTGAATAAAEAATTAAGDDAVATELAAMSARLDTLEQIVSLKDQQIATLEQALQEAREEAAAAAARAAAAPRTAPPAAPAPAAMGGIPWIPVAGGALVVLLGVIFFLRRRGKDQPLPEVPAARPRQRSSEDAFAGVSLKKESFAGAPADQAAAEGASAAGEDAARAPEDEFNRGGSRGYGESKNDDYIDDGSGGDALAEADIYIAYGRYLQAVELLNTAIDAEPGNSAYRLKLIELYVDMGEEANAAEQLTALKAQGDVEAIERAEALVGAAASASSLDEAPLAGTAEPEAVVKSEAADSASGAGDLDLNIDETDTDTESADASDASAEAPAAGAASEEASLDLDLQPGAMGAEPEEPSPAPEVPEFDQLEIESSGGEDEETPRREQEPEEVLDLTDALADFEGEDYEGEDDNGNEFMIADDTDQMATKLDLARAYLDMGDSDGARTILEEVAENGSGEQQQEARELISRIG